MIMTYYKIGARVVSLKTRDTGRVTGWTPSRVQVRWDSGLAVNDSYWLEHSEVEPEPESPSTVQADWNERA